MDESQRKLYSLVDQIERQCREKGEVSLLDLERMAHDREIRPTAVLEELSLSEGITVDLAGGKVYCR